MSRFHQATQSHASSSPTIVGAFLYATSMPLNVASRAPAAASVSFSLSLNRSRIAVACSFVAAPRALSTLDAASARRRLGIIRQSAITSPGVNSIGTGVARASRQFQSGLDHPGVLLSRSPRAARLTAGAESDDVLVQAAGHAVVAWLRQDAATPGALLDSFSRPGGPLIPQLRLVGSLVHDPAQAVPAEPPRLWWWVVADAYYRRWLEFAPTNQPPDKLP
jgi:hypothetical protein